MDCSPCSTRRSTRWRRGGSRVDPRVEICASRNRDMHPFCIRRIGPAITRIDGLLGSESGDRQRWDGSCWRIEWKGGHSSSLADGCWRPCVTRRNGGRNAHTSTAGLPSLQRWGPWACIATSADSIARIRWHPALL